MIEALLYAALCAASSVSSDLLFHNDPMYKHMAPEGTFMYMVFISLPADYCSGCIVRPLWVLTAAHCVVNASGEVVHLRDVYVIAGRSDLRNIISPKLYHGRLSHNEPVFPQVRIPVEVYPHPDYSLFHADIALLRLDVPFKKPTTILNIGRSKRNKLSDCITLGWGLCKDTEYAGVLHFYSGIFVKSSTEGCPGVEDNDHFFCHGVADPLRCWKHTGSPLVCSDMVWGIGSVKTSNDTNFTFSGQSIGYDTELYYYLNWIDKAMGKGSVKFGPGQQWIVVIPPVWFAMTYIFGLSPVA